MRADFRAFDLQAILTREQAPSQALRDETVPRRQFLKNLDFLKKLKKLKNKKIKNNIKNSHNRGFQTGANSQTLSPFGFTLLRQDTLQSVQRCLSHHARLSAGFTHTSGFSAAHYCEQMQVHKHNADRTGIERLRAQCQAQLSAKPSQRWTVQTQQRLADPAWWDRRAAQCTGDAARNFACLRKVWFSHQAFSHFSAPALFWKLKLLSTLQRYHAAAQAEFLQRQHCLPTDVRLAYQAYLQELAAELQKERALLPQVHAALLARLQSVATHRDCWHADVMVDVCHALTTLTGVPVGNPRPKPPARQHMSPELVFAFQQMLEAQGDPTLRARVYQLPWFQLCTGELPVVTVDHGPHRTLVPQGLSKRVLIKNALPLPWLKRFFKGRHTRLTLLQDAKAQQLLICLKCFPTEIDVDLTQVTCVANIPTYTHLVACFKRLDDEIERAADIKRTLHGVWHQQARQLIEHYHEFLMQQGARCVAKAVAFLKAITHAVASTSTLAHNTRDQLMELLVTVERWMKRYSLLRHQQTQFKTIQCRLKAIVNGPSFRIQGENDETTLCQRLRSHQAISNNDLHHLIKRYQATCYPLKKRGHKAPALNPWLDENKIKKISKINKINKINKTSQKNTSAHHRDDGLESSMPVDWRVDFHALLRTLPERLMRLFAESGSRLSPSGTSGSDDHALACLAVLTNYATLWAQGSESLSDHDITVMKQQFYQFIVNYLNALLTLNYPRAFIQHKRTFLGVVDFVNTHAATFLFDDTYVVTQLSVLKQFIGQRPIDWSGFQRKIDAVVHTIDRIIFKKNESSSSHHTPRCVTPPHQTPLSVTSARVRRTPSLFARRENNTGSLSSNADVTSLTTI